MDIPEGCRTAFRRSGTAFLRHIDAFFRHFRRIFPRHGKIYIFLSPDSEFFVNNAVHRLN
ncbi:MAG: hypothetical protein E7190_07455 [Erysipelotrichaceae bacterium]|nr:hypothetical protein [Erysipelotrichaceae bacterium]